MELQPSKPEQRQAASPILAVSLFLQWIVVQRRHSLREDCRHSLRESSVGSRPGSRELIFIANKSRAFRGAKGDIWQFF